MADAAPKTTLGFWPKVAIWAAVIAAGALYLGSVNHKVAKGERDAPPRTGDPPASSAAVQVAAPPAEGADATPAPKAVAVEGVNEDSAPFALPRSQAAESERVGGVPVAGSAARDPQPIPGASDEASASASGELVPEIGSHPAAAHPPGPSTGSPSQVSPAEAEAFAKAVLSDSQPEPGAGPGSASEPLIAAEPPPPPAEEETSVPQQTRGPAEHRPLSPRPEGAMRRPWHQGMGMPMVPIMPYWAAPVPGYYPPAYPPAYPMPQPHQPPMR